MVDIYQGRCGDVKVDDRAFLKTRLILRVRKEG